MFKNSILNDFKNTVSKDASAGLVVFLVALPLCLGMALASGANLFSGIISGIIGGVVIGLISGSHTSVSGPAAGLITIVLSAISSLGSYEAFMLSLVLAGILQILLGVAKAGFINLYFPSNVIKGMLAAIGLILIQKQLPRLMGSENAFTFSNVSEIFRSLHIGTLIIGLISLLILILWETAPIKNNKVLHQLPGALIAVIFGLLLNFAFSNLSTQYIIPENNLVNLPYFNSWQDFTNVLSFPDFSQLGNYQIYVTAFTIAIVASLETLLSIEAADKLDPHKRTTPQNRELLAQGTGNILSGLIGGLPITSVIVRSSANINAGNKTKMATIFHGLLLLLAVVIFPKLLNQIPLAALAAILIVVGYKLTQPVLYKKQFRLGWNQFMPFIITIIAILISDLLIGIIIGMSVGVFYILKENYKVPYFYSEEIDSSNKNKVRIKLSEHVSFLNKPSLQRLLNELPEKSSVIIDASLSKQIDHDVLEIIENFKTVAKEKDILLELENFPTLQ